jgi:hypothetical protein
MAVPPMQKFRISPQAAKARNTRNPKNVYARERSTARNGCATKCQQKRGIGGKDLLGVLILLFCEQSEGAARNGWGTDEFSTGTGPTPIFGLGDEIGGDGIPFDVMANAFELGGVSDPMVEGLILPEGLAHAVQGGVGVARRNSFHDAGDFGEGQARFQQSVNVVGHDHKSVQFIAAKLGAAQDGAFGVISDFGVGKPARSESSAIQSSVETLESFAG